ncbi:hypothetical protein H5410_049523 [Solanum commersonii]|uniref:Uncharacterized protein n=1 Tax=Solanum commersonii TaxID=4109 RepID=A0A9J5WV81_SOLCO|nr:hypothetical protein H5410_049523 [Solanum commersonii]
MGQRYMQTSKIMPAGVVAGISMAITQLQNYRRRDISGGTQRTKVVPGPALIFHCDPYSVR